MLLLGIDIGTSSIKVAVVDPATQKTVAMAHYPESEAAVLSKQPGWAEQSPEMWWDYVQQAIRKAHSSGAYDPGEIAAIGIAYQMHGLVLVDKDQQVLRDSIIWCDSRAVAYGEGAFEHIGKERSLSHLLNSPGNFTAAKLAWVKEQEPEIYARVATVLLPGDFIAMKLTGETTTGISALSEGIFLDFAEVGLSEDVFNYFGFDKGLIPAIRPVFSSHGPLKSGVAQTLSLKKGIPVTYKAGDQPNNALSLNVLDPGEVAATAGTSGVIYAVSDRLVYDKASRVNSFAHVNHSPESKRIGVLLCINGTGILNRWLRDSFGGGAHASYESLNRGAAAIEPGSDGLSILPFGNGAERMLDNRIVGAQIQHIDLNKHTPAHVYRAGQEGIAFAFRYGLDIMRENGINPSVIRAGRANMFLSDVFTDAFVNATHTPVELYDCDGSVGAALGAGIGAGIYSGVREAFHERKPSKWVAPGNAALYDELYGKWKADLERMMEA